MFPSLRLAYDIHHIRFRKVVQIVINTQTLSMMPISRSLRSRPFRAALATTLLFTTACSGKLEEALAPLSSLTRSAADEIERRVEIADEMLREEVMTHEEVVAVFAGGAPPAPSTIVWENTPFIAVGIMRDRLEVSAALPRASEAFQELMLQARSRSGRFTIIPNTVSFTLPLWRERPEGGALAGLVDVDRVFTDGVLRPLATSAHGMAFMTNRDGMIILASHPSVTGRHVSHWKIPVPGPGKTGAVGKATIDGTDYWVATEAVSGHPGWLVGAATPVEE